MEGVDIIYWDHGYNEILLLNLAIMVGLFTSLRLFSGTISHINASDELVVKDNPAFGISMAGVVFAVTIVLLGAIYGKPAYNLADSAIAVGLYGVLGIILMAVTRIIFDKIALPRVSIKNEIIKGNISAGIVDAGNVIATAIAIRAVMMWVDVNSLEGIQAVIVGYLISQVILTGMAMVHIKLYAMRYHGRSIQSCIQNGNTALALRFAGYRVGTAFAISAASSIMVYEITELHILLLAWAGVSIMMILVLTALDFVAMRIILARINVEEEIVKQKNIAIGAVQGAVYLALGMLLAGLIE